MPIIPSKYHPPRHLRFGHLSTIYSGLFRRVNNLVQKRERLALPDGDFMDLDWSFASRKTKKVVVILHGLEGNAQRPYITGCAKAFNAANVDACAVNFRGCSGVTNRLYRSYHSGATEDLAAVVNHLLLNKEYRELYINGISLGGNMALKYAGENREIPHELKAVIAVSAPCDLYSSLKELLKPKNYAYSVRFRKHLVDKLRLKATLFPEKIPATDLAKIKNLKDFDDIYTAPAHGFIDALDYYHKCSCRQFLPAIKVPSLILNAKNDSFLGKACYPYLEAKQNNHVYLETPLFGGHVGFIDSKNRYYNEKRAIKFLEECV